MREAAGALRRQRRGGGGARGGGADGVVERAADADERVPGAEGVQDHPHVHLRVRLLPAGRQPVRHIRGLLGFDNLGKKTGILDKRPGILTCSVVKFLFDSKNLSYR